MSKNRNNQEAHSPEESKQVYSNVIKYSENQGSRSFEAYFSDGAAGNVVSMLAHFLHINPGNVMEVNSPSFGSRMEESVSALPASEERDSSSEIDRVFKQRDGSIVLVMKNLKACNKTDHQARVCLLYLLYYQKNNLGIVTRDNLYDFMRGEKVYSDAFRSWVSRNHQLFIRSGNNIELSLEGEAMANKLLVEVFDTSVEKEWNPASGRIASVRKAKGAKTKSGNEPSFLRDLDLAPKGEVSLEEFMKGYQYRNSSPQLNVLFVYYLKQVRKIEEINQDHIYTCYRSLGVKLPKSIYHTLADTISKNRWLINISNLSLTSEGLNVVEHKMRIK